MTTTLCHLLGGEECIARLVDDAGINPGDRIATDKLDHAIAGRDAADDRRRRARGTMCEHAMSRAVAPFDRVRGRAGGTQSNVNRRVLPNSGFEDHSIRTARDNPRHDPVAFDIEVLRGGGVLSDAAAIEIQAVGRDVGPLFDNEQNYGHLSDRERLRDPPSRS